MEVYCRTRFEGFHKWPDAPDEVAFLRDRHRHEFHVELTVSVDHDNRDVEFILLKRELDEFIQATLLDGRDTLSCEQMGVEIADHFSDVYGPGVTVDVSEDGENGAVVSDADLS